MPSDLYAYLASPHPGTNSSFESFLEKSINTFLSISVFKFVWDC